MRWHMVEIITSLSTIFGVFGFRFHSDRVLDCKISSVASVGLDSLDKSTFNDSFSEAAADAVRAKPPALRVLAKGAMPETADIGAIVEIKNQEYVLQDVLGEGSFGKVYHATIWPNEGGTDAAIKFALVNRSKRDEYAIAANEAVLLREVSPVVQEAGLESHMSTFMEDDKLDLEGGQSIFWLVMSYTDGEALNAYIPVVEQNSALEFAARTTLTLLSQMSLLFQEVHKVLVHRDVHPGNILVDGSTHDFVLIDFGLGVHTVNWYNGSFWRHNTAGTPSYWTLGAWESLIFDEQTVQKDRWSTGESVVDNYQNRTDHFGLGLTALEMFFNWAGTGILFESAEDPLSTALFLLHEQLDMYFTFVRSLQSRYHNEDGFNLSLHMKSLAPGSRHTNFEVHKENMERLDATLQRAVEEQRTRNPHTVGKALNGIYLCMGIGSANSWGQIAKAVA